MSCLSLQSPLPISSAFSRPNFSSAESGTPPVLTRISHSCLCAPIPRWGEKRFSQEVMIVSPNSSSRAKESLWLICALAGALAWSSAAVLAIPPRTSTPSFAARASAVGGVGSGKALCGAPSGRARRWASSIALGGGLGVTGGRVVGPSRTASDVPLGRAASSAWRIAA